MTGTTIPEWQNEDGSVNWEMAYRQLLTLVQPVRAVAACPNKVLTEHIGRIDQVKAEGFKMATLQLASAMEQSGAIQLRELKNAASMMLRLEASAFVIADREALGKLPALPDSREESANDG